MSPELKPILGILAVIVGFYGYSAYLRDLFIRRTTKPHFFSWLLWGVLESIGFAAAITSGAGPGAWVLGFSAVITLTIATKAYFDRRQAAQPWAITKLDWFGFIAAALGVLCWQLTNNPTTAVIIVAATDAAAFIPTFRKAWSSPREETIIEYQASFFKHILAILALSHYSVATWLYPASLALTNGLFVGLVWWRRGVK